LASLTAFEVPISIEVGRATDELVDAFIELSSTYYHDEPVNDRRVVAWRHLEAPSGPSTTVEVVDGASHVGRMWTQMRPWTVRGRTVTAANPIDFLLREDHRSAITFMRLFRASMAASLDDADLVFHTSNPITDDLYRKLMKLEPVTELDGALVPLRPLALARLAGHADLGVLRRAVDGLAHVWWSTAGLFSRLLGVSLVDGADPATQSAIIDRFAEQEEIAAVRSDEVREWRFRGAGLIQYRTRWIRRGGSIVGYVVTTDREVNGLAGTFVVDLVAPGKTRRLVVLALWCQLAAEASRRGRDGLFFFFNKSNPRLANFVSFPLFTVARSRLPQRVPVFVRPRRDGAMADPTLDWQRGYFVLSDFDLF
jgi:hypothetical protein